MNNNILFHYIDNIYLGSTALLQAAQEGHLEVLKHLLNQGSSVQERTNKGKNDILSILSFINICNSVYECLIVI